MEIKRVGFKAVEQLCQILREEVALDAAGLFLQKNSATEFKLLFPEERRESYSREAENELLRLLHKPDVFLVGAKPEKNVLAFPLNNWPHQSFLIFFRQHRDFSPNDLMIIKMMTEPIAMLLKSLRGTERFLSPEVGDEEEDMLLEGYIIGESEAIRNLRKTINRLRASDAPVLIVGESGTGKELVARAIHATSQRRSAPLVVINCGAIPENLLESELFGYVRGAFTDAVADRQGLFERASGGTLFLDEIGDTSPAIQAKLLRVLEDGEVRRLGADASARVDVRIVAATNRDLERAIAEEKFRQDLYYRLNVVSIKLPPLRERLGDIPDLARHFVRKYAKEHGKEVHGIADDALRTMVRYHWPGNVRELENAIERAILLCPLPRTEIQLDDLPVEIVRPDVITAAAQAAWQPSPSAPALSEPPSLTPMTQTAAEAFDRDDVIEPLLPLSVATLKELTRLHILWVLRLTNGDKTEAAKLLGISRATLYRELERMKGQMSAEQEEEIGKLGNEEM